jgi:hypothetical protein
MAAPPRSSAPKGGVVVEFKSKLLTISILEPVLR